MHLPDWDQSKVHWDDFKAFHIGIAKDGFTEGTLNGYAYRQPRFVMFDTQELIGVNGWMGPYDRGEWKQLGFSVYSARDKGCPSPLWTPDGRKVYKSWMCRSGHSAPLLLVDELTKRVVCMSRWTNDQWTDIPKRFHEQYRVVVYFGGPGMPPQSRAGVPVMFPTKDHYPPHEKELLETFNHVVKTAMQLGDHPASKKRTGQTISQPWSPTPGKVTVFEYPVYGRLQTQRIFDVGLEGWQQLMEEELRSFYFNGIAHSPKQFPYLLTEKPE